MKQLTLFIYTLFISISLTAAPAKSKNPRDYNRQLLWQAGDSKDWYEWWYFKVVEPKTKKSFYFVYGLVNPWDHQQTRTASKAFVSSGSFDQKKIVEEKFTPNHFYKRDFSILQIGANNHFNEDYLAGDIVENGKRVRWHIQISHDWEFNAMGWTLFIPNVSNIYWYPAQASTKMNGWIEYDGQRTELVDVPGYQDRNWGRSFPKWWSWLVANNFKNSPGTVLAAGGGRPRILSVINAVDGFTIGLRHKGQEYSWRLPDLDKIKLNINFGTWEVQAENWKNERIEISAYADKSKFMLLPFTTPQGQEFKDYEALTGNMTVKLYKKKNFKWHLVDTLISDEAGIEFGSFNEYSLQKIFSSNIQLQ